MAMVSRDRVGRLHPRRVSSRGGLLDPANATETHSPGDAELLDRLREDPRGGLALAHARFARSINRVVWRLLGADAEHEDLVQQVFVKIIRHSASLREPDKLNAWVQAITANVVYEELRKREARRLALRELPDDERYPSLVHDVEVRDYLQQTKGLLDMLPAKERIVFSLVVLEGHPLESAAARLGYSHSTAKRRLAAARRRFSILLSRHPELFGALYHPGTPTRAVAVHPTRRSPR
jgi:RNA polymerase sigma-70 factor (ECF subfamily)